MKKHDRQFSIESLKRYESAMQIIKRLGNMLDTAPTSERAELAERICHELMRIHVLMFKETVDELGIAELGAPQVVSFSAGFEKMPKQFNAMNINDKLGVPALDVATLHFGKLLTGALNTAAKANHKPFSYATPNGLIEAAESMNSVYDSLEWLFDAIEKQLPPDTGVTH